jgi:hypothetical protein
VNYCNLFNATSYHSIKIYLHYHIVFFSAVSSLFAKGLLICFQLQYCNVRWTLVCAMALSVRICGGQSSTETGFSSSSLVFLCQYHYIMAVHV